MAKKFDVNSINVIKECDPIIIGSTKYVSKIIQSEKYQYITIDKMFQKSGSDEWNFSKSMWLPMEKASEILENALNLIAENTD